MKICILSFLLLLPCSVAEAKVKHSKSCAILLCPSHQSLIAQNRAVDLMGIQRFNNEQEVKVAVALGKLEALPITDAVQIAPSLPSNRRYALPRTIAFLLTLAEAYRTEFGVPLVVDSAVRPRTVQKKLHRFNHSAAPVDGEAASSHEAGTTVDLSRRMTKAQTRWMEWHLMYYVEIGWVIVEEERHCFHIMTLRGVDENTVSRRWKCCITKR